MAIFNGKMDNFSFKMRNFSFKMLRLRFKRINLVSKWSIFSFKIVICKLKMANLNFQRVPGQDLAENGPFAFKPHKEFIKKNTAVVLENLAARAFKKESCMVSVDRVPWAGGMKQPQESKPEKKISIKQSVRP